MKRSGIYRIVHLLTGRLYIGQAQDIDNRWKVHRRRLNGGYHHARHLAAAWTKYGPDAFSFEIVELCEVAELDAREQYWLDELRPLFNTSPTAGSTRGITPGPDTRTRLSAAGMGRKHSDETKAKQRAANLGRKFTEQHRANLRGRIKSADEIARMRAKLTGRKLSAEHRAKVGRKGPKHSPEARAKMSAANKGKPKSAAHRAKIQAAALRNAATLLAEGTRYFDRKRQARKEKENDDGTSS